MGNKEEGKGERLGQGKPGLRAGGGGACQADSDRAEPVRTERPPISSPTLCPDTSNISEEPAGPVPPHISSNPNSFPFEAHTYREHSASEKTSTYAWSAS